MSADYVQCRVQKRSNECESEKRLVKRQWLGIALTVCGARGTLAVHAAASNARGRTTALASRDYIYHILPTIRLHGTISNHFFFGPGLEQKLTIWTRFSVRVIAQGRHLSLSFYLPPSVGLVLPGWTDFLYA